MLTFRVLKLQEAPLQELVFFLDYDGSLCPHLEVWEERIYDPDEIYALVSALKPSTTAADRNSGAREIYWNTGRRVESLASVSDKFLEYPGYFIQGSVFWDAQSKTETVCGPLIGKDWAKFYEDQLKTEKGLRIEIKKSSLRIAAFQDGDRDQVTRFFESAKHPDLTGWQWRMGARGAELLSKDFDKRFAVRDGLKRTPGIPVVIGDDTLDAPAVEEAIARGGFAILVGEHCGWATEIEHKASQLLYCNDVGQAKALLQSLV